MPKMTEATKRKKQTRAWRSWTAWQKSELDRLVAEAEERGPRHRFAKRRARRAAK